MRLASLLAIVALAAGLLVGCGSDEDSGSTASTQTAPQANGSAAPAGATARECKGEGSLRATGLPCGEARQLQDSWQQSKGCAPAAEASRSSCEVEGLRCLSVVTKRGVSVSCAEPGRSIAFTAKRG